MTGFHPQAANAGNPYGWISNMLNRLQQRLRTIEGRPPAGMLTPTRLDNPPPSTTGGPTALWRLAPAPVGTGTLIGITATLTGTAQGIVTIANVAGIELARYDVPFIGDTGPYPADNGLLIVSAQRTSGSGSVVVDIVGARYGPVLLNDPQYVDGETDTADGEPATGNDQ
jgi:hypothetical protein